MTVDCIQLSTEWKYHSTGFFYVFQQDMRCNGFWQGSATYLLFNYLIVAIHRFDTAYWVYETLLIKF
jgi:hypothetical protein